MCNAHGVRDAGNVPILQERDAASTSPEQALHTITVITS
jgi:hypothetical protein